MTLVTEIDEQKRQLATRLDEAGGWTARAIEVGCVVVDQMLKGMSIGRDDVSQAIQGAFRQSEGKIRDCVIALYTEHFTDKELEEMVAFFESPVGRRLRGYEPGMQTRLQEDIHAIVGPLAERALAALDE